MEGAHGDLQEAAEGLGYMEAGAEVNGYSMEVCEEMVVWWPPEYIVERVSGCKD